MYSLFLDWLKGWGGYPNIQLNKNYLAWPKDLLYLLDPQESEETVSKIAQLIFGSKRLFVT